MSGSISRRGAQGYDTADEVNPSTEGNEFLFQEQFGEAAEYFDTEEESRGKKQKHRGQHDEDPEDKENS